LNEVKKGMGGPATVKTFALPSDGFQYFFIKKRFFDLNGIFPKTVR